MNASTTSHKQDRHSNSSIHQACVACRKRKIRCDALQPRCSYCARMNKDCVFPTAFIRAKCSQGYVEDLEARCRALELELNMTKELIPGKDTGSSSTRVNPAERTAHTTANSKAHGEGGVDFSEASAQDFAKNLEAVTRSGNLAVDLAASDETRPSLLNFEQPSGYARMTAVENALPSQTVQRSLMDAYLKSFHPIWPILDEKRFKLLIYDADYTSMARDGLDFAQLVLVLCIGSQFCEDQKKFVIEDMYQVAENIVYGSSFTTQSLELLQCLILLAHYQQATARAGKCYLTVGHATRMAQNLHFHISCKINDAGELLHNELHRRLWWACFYLDRSVSLLYGRPMSIPYRHISSPEVYQTAAQEHSAAQIYSSNTSFGTLFFYHAVDLTMVADEVFEVLHNTKSKLLLNILSPGASASTTEMILDMFTVILKLDARLLNWHNSLPHELKFSLDSKGPSTTTFSTNSYSLMPVLHIRFLHMRMILHRQTILFLLQPESKKGWPQRGYTQWPPLFSDSLSDSVIGGHTAFPANSPRSDFASPIIRLSAKICVDSATSIINLVHQYSHMEAWWWNLNAVVNSLCVLFGAMGLSDNDRDSVVSSIQEVRGSIQIGFQALANIRHRGPTIVEQCEKSLLSLMRSTSRQNDESLIAKGVQGTNQDQSQTGLLSVTNSHSLNFTDPGMDWQGEFTNIASSWTVPTGGEETSYWDSNIQNVGTLFGESFNLWGQIEDNLEWENDSLEFTSSNQA